MRENHRAQPPPLVREVCEQSKLERNRVLQQAMQNLRRKLGTGLLQANKGIEKLQ